MAKGLFFLGNTIINAKMRSQTTAGRHWRHESTAKEAQSSARLHIDNNRLHQISLPLEEPLYQKSHALCLLSHTLLLHLPKIQHNKHKIHQLWQH